MNQEVIRTILERLETLERNQRNLIRVGNVKELVGRKVVVDFEADSDSDYCSPLIPWIPLYAGEVLNWRAPTVGEMVIVINLSGGHNEANSIALPAAYCEAFSPDSLDPDKTYTTFNDVFRVETDSEGNHTLFAKKSITFDTLEFNVNASSSMNVETKTYNRMATSANTQGKHSQKGNVAITGALDVSVSVKTPAIASYAAGAFSMNAGGAVINNVTSTTTKTASCRVNGKLVEGHTHDTPVGESSPF